MTPKEKVRIIGVGCLTAAGTTLGQSIRSLDDGGPSPIPPTLFQADKPHPVFQCDLEKAIADTALLAPENELHQRCLTHMLSCNRTTQLAVLATLQAFVSSSMDLRSISSLRVGTCIGTSVGASLDFFNHYTALRQETGANLGEINRYMQSNPAEAVARFLNTRGPLLSITNACSSGTDALGIAQAWLESDLCDMAIAGGADALAQITYLGFQSLKITSEAPCKPFDAKRNGLNLGEGAAIFLVTRTTPSHSAPYGYITGYGTCTDAHHLTAPHPKAIGLNMALTMALTQAGLTKEAMGFINAHGTATPTNDVTEAAFLKNHFRETPFLSTKGATGHTLGAAGAIEAAFTLAHLNRGRIPASPAFTEEDPACAIAPVQKAVTITAQYALSQSLAFGGNNSILILERGTHESLC